MKQLRILIAIIIISVDLIAQQTPISNFYGFNEYLINPAEAGYQNRVEGLLSHRLQWQGIPGAPKTTFFGINGALNDKMGIGGKLTMDRTDILQQFTGALSYAYRVKLNEKGELNFGLSGIILQNNIRFEDVIVKDDGDDLLFGGNQEGAAFDAEAGVMLEWGKAKVGISSSHLFESGISYDLTRTSGTFDRIRLFTSYGSYQLTLNEDWYLEPSVILRNQEKGSFQYEAHALASWQEILFFGLGYRDEAGFIARAGIQFAERFMAAYAYEFSSSGLATYSNGSHEFMLGYQLFRGKTPIVKEVVDPAKELIPIEKESIETIKDSSVTEKAIEEVEKVIDEPVEKKSEIDEKQELIIEVKKDVPISLDVEPTRKEEQINKELFDQKIQFEFEQMSFNATEQKKLDKIAEELRKFTEQKVKIKGHTCDLGVKSINKSISLYRAKSVQVYLLKKGVKENQIIIEPKLDQEPIVPNTSISNRQINRRVEFELIN